jgi:PadR family transcriptional regulator AphA
MSLRHVLLVYLGSGAASGYDIVKGFRRTYGHLWNASYQQVYRDLARLRESGLVEVEQEPGAGNRPPRKVYRLNEAGRAELARFIAEPAKPPRTNDAFLVKIASAHLFDRRPLLEELRAQRRHYQRYLASLERYEAFFRAMPPAVQEPVFGAWLALSRGLSITRSWLAWADEVEAWLQRSADSTPLDTLPADIAGLLQEPR